MYDWQDVPPDAPLIAPQTAPPELSWYERKELYEKGLPSDYIREREARACARAKDEGCSVGSLLMAWWQQDKRKSPWNRVAYRTAHDHPELRAQSFDAEEFMRAALARGYDDD